MQEGCDTRSFLNEAQQVWIQSFSLFRPVAVPRLESLVFPSIYPLAGGVGGNN